MGTRNKGIRVLFSLVFLLFNLFPISKYYYCTAIDTITPSQNLSQGQTLTSPSQFFELGFFNFSGDSDIRYYIGIWYKNIFPRKVVWVANRENPLLITDYAASLVIGSDGNLKLIVDGKQKSSFDAVWSTNVSVSHVFSNRSSSLFAALSDGGNLFLKDSFSGESLWESFSHPCNTILPNMLIGLNATSGDKRFLTSWKTEDDPSPGKFTGGLALPTPPQAFIWNGSVPYYRCGQWDKTRFIGVADLTSSYTNGYELQQNLEQKTAYFSFNSINSSFVSYFEVTSAGSLEFKYWDAGVGKWITSWLAPNSTCDVYGTCGAFGVCKEPSSVSYPICKCLKGFIPKSSKEWKKGNWTGGCVRRTELLCNINDTSRSKSISLSTGDGKKDWFLKMSGMKLPDHAELKRYPYLAECHDWCSSNCSCLAYASVNGIGCMVWTTGLMDLTEFSFSGKDLFLRLAHSESLGEEKIQVKLIIIIIATLSIIILGSIMYVWFRWKARNRSKLKERGSSIEQQELLSELQMFEFNCISVATDKFSLTNKLGQGGFGPVYKGKLQDGQEIAVKRLSNSSGQGVAEFKNEIILISKLQHRNLVRLLGCCIERDEMLLIYEYMSNKSLDTFLFDSTKRVQLDWEKRFNIIEGIARGLLYLHRDSCLRVIHRDLKVSNILLDEYMSPKISDFGIARTFQETQNLANTNRVVGTFGYMSPEYVTRGIFSEKSDVFSFGVLLLEIVSGKKNSCFNYLYDNQHLTLLSYAWELWKERKGIDVMDQALAESFSELEVMRCIHVGLLCVQDHASDRPTMWNVVFMLSSETDRPEPKKPTFTFQSSPHDRDLHPQGNNNFSPNESTISLVRGR